MNKKLKLESTLLTGVFLLLFALMVQTANAQEKEKGKPWHAPESAAKVKSPVPANEENIAAGKALYSKHCKSCHGASGKGDGTKSATLDISCGDFTSEEFMKQSEGEVFWKTSEGRDPMPSFKKKISDEERWQVVAYVRTLGEKKK
jgi:mono/diheme cytochrome c family protein